VIFLAAWQLAAITDTIDSRLFPAPSTIWSQGVAMVQDGTLQAALGVSLRRIGLGLALGVVTGVGAGLAMGVSSYLRAAFEPLLSSFYTVPKLALLPLLLIIFGVGEEPIIIIIGMTVFFFMWISTMAAVMAVPDGYREVSRSFGSSRWAHFRHVLLPASLPQMLVALRIATGVAVLVVVGVEFVASSDGIGQLIWYSWTLLLTAQMYVGIVCVAIMGVVLTSVVKFLSRRVVPWADDSAVGGTNVL
jgi:NitT/TauT family transport system permease protein/sulfonate transport system permease protein